MIFLADLLLLAASLALLIPALVLFVECAAALLPGRPRPEPVRERPRRIDVIVPAHDEESVIGTCLDSLRPQLAERDRVWVVADNCADGTARIARELGAAVLERNDPTRFGKGYALDFAVRHLAADPPDVVIVMDADCVAHERFVESLAGLATATGRPVQSHQVLRGPAGANRMDLLMVLAYWVKTFVRPSGLHRLGLPCFFMGAGMAFPWATLRDTPLASARTAVDYRLTVALALIGEAPLFCPDAVVVSETAPFATALESQRVRWEHGHLDTLLREGPRLFRAAIRQRRPELLALALDLCVPPLALLVLCWLGAVFVAILVLWAGGSIAPIALLATGGFLIGTAVGSAWLGFMRSLIPASAFLVLPGYLCRKIPLYVSFLRHRRVHWPRERRGVDR